MMVKSQVPLQTLHWVGHAIEKKITDRNNSTTKKKKCKEIEKKRDTFIHTY